jgi:hypothetical protein
MHEKTGRAAYDLAMELLVRFKTLAAIERAGINEICEVEGIGRAGLSRPVKRSAFWYLTMLLWVIAVTSVSGIRGLSGTAFDTEKADKK